MLQASLFLIIYNQSFLISSFNIRLMITTAVKQFVLFYTKLSLLILFDLLKVFDSMDHNILQRMISYLGASSQVFHFLFNMGTNFEIVCQFVLNK